MLADRKPMIDEVGKSREPMVMDAFKFKLRPFWICGRRDSGVKTVMACCTWESKDFATN